MEEINGTTELTEEKVERTDSLTFDDKVIKKIVGYSINEVPGILAMSGNLISGITDMLKGDDPTKGITVEMSGNKAVVSMKVICEYGRNVPAIYQEIVEKTGAAVKEMTGIEVTGVKVHVNDVLTKEDFDKQSKRKREEVEQEAAAEAPAGEA